MSRIARRRIRAAALAAFYLVVTTSVEAVGWHHCPHHTGMLPDLAMSGAGRAHPHDRPPPMRPGTGTPCDGSGPCTCLGQVTQPPTDYLPASPPAVALRLGGRVAAPVTPAPPGPDRLRRARLQPPATAPPSRA